MSVDSFLDVAIELTCKSKQKSQLAVITEDSNNSLSYDDLQARITDLASCLQRSIMTVTSDNDEIIGVPMISIMTDRNIAMIVGILAILKIGAAYVPVDPSFPPDRQSYIFSHSKSILLVADLESHSSAMELGVQLPMVVLLDPVTGKVHHEINHIDEGVSIIDSALCSAEEDSFHRRITSGNKVYSKSRTPQDVAYVLYTSGSTGKPKGVMVTHEGVVNIVSWFAKELRVDQSSVVLGLTTFCFDISVLEMFLPLMYGGTLVIAKSSTQKDPYRVLDIIEQRGVTIMQATPTTYEMMLATGWEGDPRVDLLVCRCYSSL